MNNIQAAQNKALLPGRKNILLHKNITVDKFKALAEGFFVNNKSHV